jgi:hypothetical protein
MRFFDNVRFVAVFVHLVRRASRPDLQVVRVQLLYHVTANQRGPIVCQPCIATGDFEAGNGARK